jgi:hypothetical protein
LKKGGARAVSACPQARKRQARADVVGRGPRIGNGRFHHLGECGVDKDRGLIHRLLLSAPEALAKPDWDLRRVTTQSTSPLDGQREDNSLVVV